MTTPNLLGATVINGKTQGANLTTTSSTTVLNNASGSNGKSPLLLKVGFLI